MSTDAYFIDSADEAAKCDRAYGAYYKAARLANSPFGQEGLRLAWESFRAGWVSAQAVAKDKE